MAGKNGRYAVVASAEDDAELLEEGKLLPEPEQITAAAVCAELGHGLALAGPTVVIQLCNMFAWTLTTSMVGSQLGVDALTGASLANLAGNLTGLSIVYGTLSAMDTLAPRCVGTGQYSELGLLSQRASALCFLLMLPVCVMWWNVEYLLSAAGQPPAACALAGQFLRIYILQMPSLICLEVCRRFCIVQDIIVFFIPNAMLMLAVHFLCLWIGLPLIGFAAAPIAHVCSQTTGCVGALTYLRCAQPHHPESWKGVNLHLALGPKSLLKYAQLGLPGMFSMGEWWFWESICFMAGMLGNLQLATHTIGYAMIPLGFMVPLAMGIAVSARIGMLLASRRVKMARALTRLTESIFIVVCACYSFGFYQARGWIIMQFTADPQVSARADAIWPWVCSFIFFDGFMGLQQGFLKALGLQARMMWVYLVWLWMAGQPIAYYVAFEMRGLAPQWCVAVDIPADPEPPIPRDTQVAGARDGDLALCGLWQMMTPLYIVLDALLIAAFMSKDWDSVSQKIYDEAQETKQLLASDGSEGIELEQSMARARSPASQEEAAD